MKHCGRGIDPRNKENFKYFLDNYVFPFFASHGYGVISVTIEKCDMGFHIPGEEDLNFEYVDSRYRKNTVTIIERTDKVEFKPLIPREEG